jgi:hypothetical protein
MQDRTLDLTEEAIAARAYEIWEERGRPEGQSEAHWFEAIQDLSTTIVIDLTKETEMPIVREVERTMAVGQTDPTFSDGTVISE